MRVPQKVPLHVIARAKPEAIQNLSTRQVESGLLRLTARNDDCNFQDSSIWVSYLTIIALFRLKMNTERRLY